MGACNDLKRDLDICFRREKEEARMRNMLLARESEREFTRSTGISLNPSK